MKARLLPTPSYHNWPHADLCAEAERLIGLLDRAACEFKRRAALPVASHTGYESFATPELSDELNRLVSHLRAINRALVPPGARCLAATDYGYPRDEHAHHLGAV